MKSNHIAAPFTNTLSVTKTTTKKIAWKIISCLSDRGIPRLPVHGKPFLAYRIGESVDLPVHGKIFLAYRIGESVDLPVHGKPYLSPHHSELLECLPTQKYTGEEFRLSPRCMDDFRFSDVT